jgi:hypothetical protein
VRHVLEHFLAVLAGRFDSQRAGVDDPVPQRANESDVADPTEGDITASVAQDAAADEDPMGGDHIMRGAPGQPRADAEPAEQHERHHQHRDQEHLAGCAVGLERDRRPGRRAQQQEPQCGRDQRDPVRMQVLDDLLVIGEQLLGV